MKMPRYPVYVISKGRSDCCLTARALIQDRVPFSLVVEPQEADDYAREFPRDILRILPFSNLGLGSIPARNWVWEHALASGAERHWILDDNIGCMYRRWKARKFYCEFGPALAAMEDFTDRFSNVAISGANYHCFAPNLKKAKPYCTNVHVYSNLLILNSLPCRWRGRYNEDTDLCLQVLAKGWCTILFNAFLVRKMATMTMKGGNTDTLYKGDGRLKMARSLERVWPYVVETKRRFRRPQHYVRDSWRKFDTPLKYRDDFNPESLQKIDEYGLVLTKDETMDIETSPEIKRIAESVAIPKKRPV